MLLVGSGGWKIGDEDDLIDGDGGEELAIIPFLLSCMYMLVRHNFLNII